MTKETEILFSELPNDFTIELSDTAEFQKLKAEIRRVLLTLTRIEERILRLRFGLGGIQQHTIRQISEQLGKTLSETRIIEERAIRKLKHPVRTFFLRHFLETL